METVLASVRKDRPLRRGKPGRPHRQLRQRKSSPASSSKPSTTWDAPVGRIGAANGISPQAEGLEKAFLPNAGDIYAAVAALL